MTVPSRARALCGSWLAWLGANSALILILAALVLFTSKSLYNVPVGIMAILGLVRVVRAPGVVLRDDFVRILLALFLCLWLPMLVSLPDAANPARSAHTVLAYLRFPLMGIFVIHEFRCGRIGGKLMVAIVGIVGFWCVDAMIQFLFGANLFGYPYEEKYITGMFYPKITIAHVCAALSPLLFEGLRIHAGKHPWLWALLVPLFAVILLSGRRSTWIMLAVSVAGYLAYLYRLRRLDSGALKALALVGGAVMAVTIAILATHKPLQNRIRVTAGIFSGEREATDKALGRRLTLFETSRAIIGAHWLNGVGPRGYRYVYREYADPDNYFYRTTQTHPHQLLLEVLVETGVIGLAGLLLFVLLLYRFVREKRLGLALFPWLLALFTAAFPFNTHMAFYGSYWSSVLWWLLVLMLASGAACTVGQEKNGA